MKESETSPPLSPRVVTHELLGVVNKLGWQTAFDSSSQEELRQSLQKAQELISAIAKLRGITLKE